MERAEADGGFWFSPVGSAQGSKKDLEEMISILNGSEKARHGIPAGYRYDVGGQRQFILWSGKGKAPTPPLVTVKSSKKSKDPIAPATVPPPMPASVAAGQPPAPVAPPRPTRPYQKGLPVPIPPMPAAEKPRLIETSPPNSVPKAIPYNADVKPAPAPAPAKATPKPSSSTAPKLIADAPPATPVTLPAPKPALVDNSPPPGTEINGIPAAMQKSFLSRNKSVFMIFDKDKGSWSSSPGAIRDLETADEWCKQATKVDREYGRIPSSFSYRHVGSGQVQITRE